jgi:hypothetical protein
VGVLPGVAAQVGYFVALVDQHFGKAAADEAGTSTYQYSA